MTVDPKIIQNAMAFLGRVDLKGTEVQAFIEVAAWLQAIARENAKEAAPLPPPSSPDGEV